MHRDSCHQAISNHSSTIWRSLKLNDTPKESSASFKDSLAFFFFPICYLFDRVDHGYLQIGCFSLTTRLVSELLVLSLRKHVQVALKIINENYSQCKEAQQVIHNYKTNNV